MKIGFISLGCPKNRCDTEVMLKEIAGAYESHTEGKRLRESDSGAYLNG